MGAPTKADARQIRVPHSGHRRAEDQVRTFNRKAGFTILDELQPSCERYARAKLDALEITARLGSSELVIYDPLHLDAMLSWAVLHEATEGLGIVDEGKVYYIPLPVMRLWTSACGLPLWASSDFFPVGTEHRSTTVMHKRHRWPFKTRTGKYMDTRIPKPTAVTSSGCWMARCYGNRDEIERLLKTYIHSMGKHRHDGFGHVKEWAVETVDFASLDALICDGQLIRPFPELALEHFDFEPEGSSSLVGWTQPYWKPRNFNYGWHTGAVVAEKDIDYYDAV